MTHSWHGIPRRRLRRPAALLTLAGALLLAARAAEAAGPAQIEGLGPHRLNANAPVTEKWKESELVLPDFPQDGNLLEFYVSAVATNRFFIDSTSLTAGTDGVIRYVLVVKTPGGAVNTTFEGIRCGARQFRLYATGRSDATWSAARVSEWLPIENKPVNRHHAALSREFFCPRGAAINDADEGRDALRRGRHPNAD